MGASCGSETRGKAWSCNGVISAWVEELAAHAGQGGARHSKDQVEVLSQDNGLRVEDGELEAIR